MDNNIQMEPLTVNAKEAARLLGICERTLRTLTKSGELPVVRIMTRVLYSVEDLREFIRQRSKKESNGES